MAKSLDEMTDEELDAALQKSEKSKSVDEMDDAELDMLLYEAQNDSRSPGKILVDAINPLNIPKNLAAGLEKIDEYTGAPVRKFTTELATGKKLDKAPTGKEQAQLMGFTPKTYDESLGLSSKEGTGIPVIGDMSPAGVMGFGLDVVQDPLLLLAEASKPLRSLFEAGKEGASALKTKVSGRGAQTQAAEGIAEAGANAEATINVKPISVRNEVKMFREKPPKSLEELRSWAPSLNQSDLPGKARLRAIDSNVADLETRPLKYHYEMMENPKAMKKMKLEFENLPSKDAEKIASYNQAMVNESESKLRSTIDGLIPHTEDEIASAVVKQPKSMPDAGLDFISQTKAKYNQEKETLAPLFEELQNAPPLPAEQSQDLIQGIAANTKLGKLLEASDGGLKLAKNTPKSGISDEEHRVLARVVESLNDGATFKELQDIREFMRKYIDPSNPSAMSEVGKVRSYLLDQMENLSGEFGKSTRDVFRKYAINERARENIEKIIGGQIESLDQVYAANPDKVVNKIFSNPNYVDVAKQYLGEDAIKDMIAAKVKSGLDNAYDTAKGFQPHVFKKWLNSNKTFTSRYLDPEVTQRLTDLADYGYYGRRFLDDVNPSGTAAALLKAIEPGDIVTDLTTKGIVGTATSQTAGRVKNVLKQRQAQKFFAEAIGETPRAGAGQGMVEKMTTFNPNQGLMMLQQSAAPQAALRSQNMGDNQGPSPMPVSNIQRAKETNLRWKTMKGIGQ